jgi:hypothetical protein
VDAKPIGAALSRDISADENSGKDLETFIAQRYELSQRRDEGAGEEMWAASCRRHNAELEAEAGLAKLAWARHLRTVYAARMEEWDKLVQKLEGTVSEATKGAR